MHRFWFDSNIDGSHITLKDKIFHHICRVCRFEVKDRFMLVSPQCRQYTVELQEKHKDWALAVIIEVNTLPKRKKPYIHLALSCPRFSVLEALLKKLVELDVSDFHPFVSELSFIRKTSSLPPARLKRWENIVQHSMAQSKCSGGIKIHPLMSMSEVLIKCQKQSHSQVLFFYEGKGQKSVYTAMSELSQKTLDHVWIFLGGEGGFSPKEVLEFEALSIAPISLGSSILRVETACLTAISVLKYTLKLF